MNKVLIINGVSAEITMVHFLEDFFKKKGYQVELMNILDEVTVIESVSVSFYPDIIVGFSLGGMVSMILAEKYPKSKLILVATGCRIDPENNLFKLLLMISQEKKVVGVMRKLAFLPKNVLVPIYKKINFELEADELANERYILDMNNNIDYFRKVSLNKWIEVIKFCRETDLGELALKLRNETLIFSGNKDALMPVSLGKELNSLIVKSQLIMTDGGHFNVISEADLEAIEKFI